MIGLKIINVAPERGGMYDYKGLDINKFVPGSQVYPSGTRDFYVITEEDNIPKHEDVIRISTEEYEVAYEAEKEMQQEPSQEDVLGQELTQVKIKNIQQQSVIDGLGRELTQSRLDNTQQKQTVDSLGAELTKAKLEIITLKGGEV